MAKSQYSDPIAYEDDVLVRLGLRRQPTTWRAVIKAIYGSQLTDEELAIYRRLSGGLDPRPNGAKRVLLVFGRRSGKSTAAARIGWFEATQRDHYRFLEPGQVGSVSIVAQDLAGADQVLKYTQGLAGLPPLKRKHVARIPVESVDFKDGIRVEKVAASEQAVRSRTAVTVICDEISYWDQTGPDEDRKVMAALTPSLLAGPSAPTRRLIAITSAGYQRGLAHEIWQRDFGRADAPWLVLSGSTLDLRPDLDPKEIEDDCAGDPYKKAREYESKWGDLTASGFFTPDMIAACVDPLRTSATPIPYADGAKHFLAIDPSFERDMFAIAVVRSHLAKVGDDRKRRTDLCLLEAHQPKPGAPLSVHVIARRVATVAAEYQVTRVFSDQHASAPLAEALREYGLKLEKRSWHSGAGDDSKAARFSSVREAMIAKELTLPNDPDLIRELQSIVSEPLPNGGLKIRGKGKNDDRAHAVVLATSEALLKSPGLITKSLHPWEKYQRDMRDHQFAMLFGAATYRPGMPTSGMW